MVEIALGVPAEQDLGGEVTQPEGVQRKKAIRMDSLFRLVLPLGLEPRTPTLRVSCSTN